MVLMPVAELNRWILVQTNWTVTQIEERAKLHLPAIAAPPKAG
jgi:hypothetical protein